MHSSPIRLASLNKLQFCLFIALQCSSSFAWAQQTARFDDIRGWRDLPWSTSIEEMRTVLTRAGVHFAESQSVGLFPRNGQVVEQSFTNMTWTEDGREHRIEFQNNRLHEVRISRRGSTRSAAVGNDLERLTQRFGRAPLPVNRWRNATTHLQFSIFEYGNHVGWIATELWSAAP